MKYNIFQNTKYLFKQSKKRGKKMKIWLVSIILTSLLIPLLGTILTSVVVYLLENNYDIKIYTLYIIGLILITILFETIKIRSENKYLWESTFVRCSDFWLELSSKILNEDYQKVEPKQCQKEISKAFNSLDSNWVGIEGMLRQTPTFYINSIGLIIYGVIISIYIPYVAIILIFMTIFNFLLTSKANKYLDNNINELNDYWYEEMYLTKDVTNCNNGKDIRIYQMNNWINKLFRNIKTNSIKIFKKFQKIILASNFSDSIFLFLRDLLSYGLLIVMVIDKKIDVATFTFLIGIVATFSTWLNGFVESFNELRKNNLMVNRYRNYLNDNKEINKEYLNIDILKEPYKIEFKNVSFKYPYTDKYIFKDLNFVLDPLEKVALVGYNGAGKTTLVKLLSGLYEPTEGEILINNYNINNFKKEDYMKLFSVVFQDSEPLAFSIKENISGLNKDYNEEKIIKSLKDANLYDKVESLDDKLDTFITQEFNKDGIRLSGGETQKLMLARALYKDGKILVLDEPTSALDPLSEEKMYLSYHNLTKNNTSLFISHRLSSTKFCDRIIFLDNGKIIENGTHDELIKKKGKYFEMFEIQSKYYRKEYYEENNKNFKTN